jgi:hypothetical protein
VVEADDDLAGTQSPEHDVLDEGLGLDGRHRASEREHDRGGNPGLPDQLQALVEGGDGRRGARGL